MHSALVRGQNVFGFFTSVAFFVAGLAAISVLFSPQTPSGTIQLSNIQVARGRPHYYSYKKEEYAHIRFDLDTDISTLFNWNTKQVFIYIKATYPAKSPSEPPSEAIIWDAILASPVAPWHQNHYIYPSSSKTKSKSRSKSKSRQPPSPQQIGKLSLKNQRPKYQITDNTGRIANRTDAILELGWNIQPWVGALVWANTDRSYGLWQKLKGGRSDKFNFPGLKGAAKKEELGAERGGEKYRDKPHIG